LSRITEPTTGRAELYGRVGSLLEVGTGFHPELTGRENIFLNGAIMGMSRGHIESKFDQIVDFAEVDKFIDTPVKRYSSGMYVRLAFAVAAHMDPDVLIVDEVLAVGDVDFRKKCIGKMGEVGAQGRTVLFVSHSIPSVLSLCSRAILLDGGKLVADGSPLQVTRRYLHSDSGSASERVWATPEEAPGDSMVKLHAVRAVNNEGQVQESFDIRQELFIEIEYWNLSSPWRPTISIHFVNDDGVRLFVSNDFNNHQWWATPRQPGLVRCTCKVPGNLLAEGRIFVTVALCNYNPDMVHGYGQDAVSFEIVDRSDGDAVRGPYTGEWPGVLRPMLEWETPVDHRGALAAPQIAVESNGVPAASEKAVGGKAVSEKDQ
jgi:lipopolysaccharide transport system ATP-binding protein